MRIAKAIGNEMLHFGSDEQMAEFIDKRFNLSGILIAAEIAKTTLDTVWQERDPKNLAAKCAAERLGNALRLNIVTIRAETMTRKELIEAAEWLEEDARYLNKQAVIYAARTSEWYNSLAEIVSANATHSAGLAVDLREKAKLMEAN